jgi:3D (Asp-Asp-Asp) domain-containing protein
MHEIASPPTARSAPVGAASSSNGHSRVIWMQVTAYCGCKKCCGPSAHGMTASGRSIAYNGGLFVAADTSLLPFGTQLQIPGYAGGQAVEVIDRGSAIRGSHIDVFFPTHDQALAWGRRWMPVTVVQ